MTTDNKQSLTLSDAEIISLAYDCNAMPEAMTDAGLKRFARAIIDVALSKLRGVGEPLPAGGDPAFHAWWNSPHSPTGMDYEESIAKLAWHVARKRYAAPQASAGEKAPPITAEEVWIRLISIMEKDNGYTFPFTVGNFAPAREAIQSLIRQGFFLDDPNDLKSDFWLAAAGDQDAAIAHFPIGSFDDLSKALNVVFDRPVAESPAKGEGDVDLPPLVGTLAALPPHVQNVVVSYGKACFAYGRKSNG